MASNINIDYDRWLNEQTNLLRERNFGCLDTDNLIEELEALGRAEKAAVKSLVYQILLHLLLIDYWEKETDYNRRHWQAEVNSFQFQLEDKLTTNLKQLIEENLGQIYAKARKGAILKSNLYSDCLPDKCPYSWEQILGVD